MNPFRDREDWSVFDIDEKFGVYTCSQNNIMWLMFMIWAKLFPNRDFKGGKLPEADHCRKILKEKCPDLWNKHIEGKEDLHIPVPDFEECMRVIANDILGEENISPKDKRLPKQKEDHFKKRFCKIS